MGTTAFLLCLSQSFFCNVYLSTSILFPNPSLGANIALKCLDIMEDQSYRSQDNSEIKKK